MKDKELFDFFKNRSASFDEMPSTKVWNKINRNNMMSKKTSFFSISKIVTWSFLAIIAVLTSTLIVTKDEKESIQNTNNKPIQEETILETNSSEKYNSTEIDSGKKDSDTLKTEKIFIKKTVLTITNQNIQVINNLPPILKSDSIIVLHSEVENDSIIIPPQVKGNRLLFETKKLLTAVEFESFVRKIVEENKTNYGSLLVIKAKGNKPFRKIVQFPEKTIIPKTMILPIFYTTKLIISDSLLLKDSINFNLRK